LLISAITESTCEEGKSLGIGRETKEAGGGAEEKSLEERG